MTLKHPFEAIKPFNKEAKVRRAFEALHGFTEEDGKSVDLYRRGWLRSSRYTDYWRKYWRWVDANFDMLRGFVDPENYEQRHMEALAQAMVLGAANMSGDYRFHNFGPAKRDGGWKRCPLLVEIAIHYHCHPGDFPRMGAPAVQGCIQELVNHGLLERCYNDGIFYKRTPALKPWVDAITQVPWPVKDVQHTVTWAVPNN